MGGLFSKREEATKARFDFIAFCLKRGEKRLLFGDCGGLAELESLLPADTEQYKILAIEEKESKLFDIPTPGGFVERNKKRIEHYIEEDGDVKGEYLMQDAFVPPFDGKEVDTRFDDRWRWMKKDDGMVVIIADSVDAFMFVSDTSRLCENVVRVCEKNSFVNHEVYRTDKNKNPMEFLRAVVSTLERVGSIENKEILVQEDACGMMMCRFPNFFKPNFSAVARIGGFKLHELMRDGREFPKRKKKRYEKK